MSALPVRISSLIAGASNTAHVSPVVHVQLFFCPSVGDLIRSLLAFRVLANIPVTYKINKIKSFDKDLNSPDLVTTGGDVKKKHLNDDDDVQGSSMLSTG